VPIYEYVCLDCGRTSSFLTPSFRVELEPKCEACGSPNMRKLVSRVAVLRSGRRASDDFDGGDVGPDSAGPMDDEGLRPGNDFGDDGDDEGSGGDLE